MLRLRDRFVLEAGDVGQIAVQGSLVDHEYTFERDGSRIAEVSKRWVRAGDTDRVSKPGADIALTLAVTAAIDSMTWEGCRRSRWGAPWLPGECSAAYGDQGDVWWMGAGPRCDHMRQREDV